MLVERVTADFERLVHKLLRNKPRTSLAAAGRARIGQCTVRLASWHACASDPGRSRCAAAVAVHSRRLRQERVDIGRELGVMLEQEAVCCVRVDLDPRVRNEACQQVRLVRRDHGIAVAVGHEYGLSMAATVCSCE
jgi:hypothetical protein